jgi:hypothetical protein
MEHIEHIFAVIQAVDSYVTQLLVKQGERYGNLKLGVRNISAISQAEARYATQLLFY